MVCVNKCIYKHLLFVQNYDYDGKNAYFATVFIKKVTFGTNNALCRKFLVLQSTLFWCYFCKFLNVSMLTVLIFACLSFMYPLPTLFSCG